MKLAPTHQLDEVAIADASGNELLIAPGSSESVTVQADFPMWFDADDCLAAAAAFAAAAAWLLECQCQERAWNEAQIVPHEERAPRLNYRTKAHRELRAEVMRRQDFTCQECGYRPEDHQIPANYDGKRTIGFWPYPADRLLHVDHIRPRARGGQNLLSNLQVLCEPCNIKKGHR